MRNRYEKLLLFEKGWEGGRYACQTIPFSNTKILNSTAQVLIYSCTRAIPRSAVQYQTLYCILSGNTVLLAKAASGSASIFSRSYSFHTFKTVPPVASKTARTHTYVNASTHNGERL